MVLILKNIAAEGPGTIAEYLDAQGMPYRVLEAGEGPPSLGGCTHLVVLGGPIGVYEAEDYPQVAKSVSAIREALDRDLKVLGVCLGAQAVAHALGANVYPGGSEEIGWLDIKPTPEGLADPVFSRLAEDGGPVPFKVFHWHGDTFDLPRGAVRLATSDMYPNQAFRYGTGAYALQFHIEVTTGMLGQWFIGDPKLSGIQEQARELDVEYSGRATRFYEAFFN